MYCSTCGSKNADGAAFCSSCGQALSQGMGAAGQHKHVLNQAYPANNTKISNTFPNYPEGCARAAWNDVKASSGWLGKVFLLGLIMLVPILNFFVAGYCMLWSRDLVKGQKTDLPQKICAEEAFVQGFYWWVLSLVVALIIGVIGIILGIIPFLGGLLSLAVSVLIGAVAVLCGLRIALSNRLGAGFEFSAVWSAAKQKFGSLFAASFFPELIIGLILSGIITLLVALMVILLSVTGIDLYQLLSIVGLSGGKINAAEYQMFITFLGLVALFLIIMAYLATVCLSLTMLIVFRAVAYWVCRYAPEWAQDVGLTEMGYANPNPTVYAVNQQPHCTPAAVSVSPSSASPVSVPSSVPASSQVCRTTGPLMRAEENSGGALSDFASNNGLDTILLDEMQDADIDTSVLNIASAQMRLMGNGGRYYDIYTFPAVIGKGSTSDVKIEGNSSVSRSHARIEKVSGGYAITDLQSTNKTFINGSAIDSGKSYLLEDGMNLKFGNEVFKVVL